MLSESGEGKEMAPEVNRTEGKKMIFPSKKSLLHLMAESFKITKLHVLCPLQSAGVCWLISPTPEWKDQD